MFKNLVFCLLFISTFQVFGQRTELGAWAGIANYFGDLNTNTSFQFVGPGAGVYLRTNVSKRFAVKQSINLGIISFDESSTNDPHKIQRNLSFKSNVFELSSHLEFNFLEYDKTNEKKLFTPYILTGLSVFYFNPRAEFEGQWYDLQPLGTEGQNDPNYTGRERYRLISFAIPIGGGLKYSFAHKWNIGLEFVTRKTFTDYLDDVSTTYVSPLSLPGGEGGISHNLADPSVNKIGQPGYQRGTTDKNDDYFFGGITLSYTFMRDRCPKPKAFQ